MSMQKKIKRLEPVMDEFGRMRPLVTYGELYRDVDPVKKSILDHFEESIANFLNTLDNANCLKSFLTRSEVNRLIQLHYTSMINHSIVENCHIALRNYINPEFQSSMMMIKNEAAKYKMDFTNGLEQLIHLVAMGYVHDCEYTKRILIAIIDFSKLGIRNPQKLAFGSLMGKLKSHGRLKRGLRGNLYVEFLNSKKRNAIAHYSFYFENHKIFLCIDGQFDQNPTEISLDELVEEGSKMNITSIALFLIRLQNKNTSNE